MTALEAPEPLVLVLGQWSQGQVDKAIYELLGDARKLAPAWKARVELVLPAVPKQSGRALQELQAYVRERVHLVEHPLLETYSTETFLQALEPVLRQLRPRLVMLLATANGRDLGPRLAARLGMGFVPHCLTSRVERDGRLVLTRVSHGGRVHVQSVWAGETPVILTMKPGVGDTPVKEAVPEEFPVERHPMEIQAGRVRVLEQIPPDPKTQDLREATRIVAGGRGVGSGEGFRVIQELADALQASVGASRVAVDLGWMEYARQVGQTGKTVAPALYVAAGISGASHHLVGMRGSEKIVAINADKKAPIFSLSHFGAVGDLHQILPRLTERIRQHHRQTNNKATLAETAKR